MATNTFFKNIVIKDKKSATKFINALENAENKKAKKVKVNKIVKEISDGDTIKEIFK